MRVLRNLFRRRRVERDLELEIDAYLGALTDQKIAAGMAPEAARRAARLELGGVDQIKESVRDVRAGARLETLGQDLRYGLRMLRRSPGFTFVAVLTLALGVGANAAIFSVVRAVLLRPLPYAEPDRLVLLRQSYPQRGLAVWRLSQANFAAYREQARSFARLAAYTRAGTNASGAGETVRLDGANVSAEFFDTFGVAPALGRAFRSGEDAPGRRPLCVLSHGQWQRQFGGDPGVIGRTLTLDNVPTEIVGVMPPHFDMPPGVQVWVTLDLGAERTSPFNLLAIGRLRPGATMRGAEAEATHVLKAGGAANPAFLGSEAAAPPDADLHAVVAPLQEALTRQSRTPLLLLFGAVGMVLLIACANVANMLLARAATRSREIAVRLALGATGARVVRQLMTECLLLGALGCAAGLALAAPGLRLLTRIAPGGIPRLDEADLDAGVLAFAVATGLATAALSGLLPALRAHRLGLQQGLRGSAHATTTPAGRRTNGALVGLQFALSLVLLVGTGLLLRSLERLMAVDPGYETERVLTLRIHHPPGKPAGYANPFAAVSGDEGRRTRQFYGEISDRVRRLPGVSAACLFSSVPLSGDIDADGTVVKGHEPQPGEPIPVTRILRVSDGCFRTLGIPLLLGRDFGEGDGADAARVAIADEALARRYWKDGAALGGAIRFSWDTDPAAWRTIVGVVSGIREESLGEAPAPHLYLPFAQETQRQMSLLVRTEGDPAAAAGAVRAAVRGVDPGVPTFAVRTMEEMIGESLSRERFTNVLLGLFGVTALLLAAAGIYGVMSLEVTSRLRELAIRMALGARPGGIFGLVLRHGAGLAAGGMLAGLAGALALTRLLGGLLFEVTPTDPATFVTVGLLLMAVAILACYVPARRAMRVDPIAALRQD